MARRRHRMRRMSHGGSHCGPGMVFQDGGCVPSMRVGGRTRPIRRMPHGGPHNASYQSRYCPNGNYGFDEFGNQICV